MELGTVHRALSPLLAWHGGRVPRTALPQAGALLMTVNENSQMNAGCSVASAPYEPGL